MPSSVCLGLLRLSGGVAGAGAGLGALEARGAMGAAATGAAATGAAATGAAATGAAATGAGATGAATGAGNGTVAGSTVGGLGVVPRRSKSLREAISLTLTERGA